jgi:hypothetical protein
MNSKWILLPVMIALAGLILPLLAQSIYPTRLKDSEAVCLGSPEFPVHADGVSDDTIAIQAAINAAEAEHLEGIWSCIYYLPES